MTQEEKQLLFKDLSGRLLYKVCFKNPFFVGITNTLVSIEPDYNNDVFGNAIINGKYKIELIKLYLRPMSSITDDEIKDFEKASQKDIDIALNEYNRYYGSELEKYAPLLSTYNKFDWLNAHHFDYRGLIEKGLALEAPEGMYNS